MKRPHPDRMAEEAARAKGATLIFGVDEVGRGPLAGPVTAAAIALPRHLPPEIADAIDDSKRISATRRAWLADELPRLAPCTVAHASVAEIEALNIRRASHLAMCRAVATLADRIGAPDLVLVDGHEIPEALAHPARAIIKGDASCLVIAAASILAKVARDRLMARHAQDHPGYGWERNAGYGTPQHLSALRRLGVTPIHRRTFGTVHKILCQSQSPTS